MSDEPRLRGKIVSRETWKMRGIDCEQSLDEIEALQEDLYAATAEAAALRRTLEEARAERDMWKRRAETLLGRRGGPGQGQVADFALAPPAATPPPCAWWCGTPGDELRGQWCTEACEKAGRPLHPEKP